MKLIRASIMLAAWCLATLAATAQTRKPNIIFIIADDLGYGDLGCYGQKKIATPNLDRMAAEGMRLTQHYSGNAVCAPSRCVLLTGLHPGHAQIRDNREMKPEGQYPLLANTQTLPRLLQKAGYRTGAFGKWGLGAPGTDGVPLKQGIDRFFGYNCQAVAHNYYPTHLWDNEERIRINNPPFAAHQKLPAGADPKDPETYAAFNGNDYAPDLINEQARKFITDNKDRPFFCFLPTTVPHLAIQVPEDSLAEYAGKFPEEPYAGGRGYLPHPTPRAAYAAMITRMDREVGRIMELVKQLKLDDNTIFVFTSDNGPLYDKLGGTDCDFFQSAGALRGRKGALYEGGFRVPGIVRWKGKIKPGQSAHVTGFEDWLPTLLELIGEKAPAVDGISFAPTLLGKRQPERPFLYREFPGYGGQQMVREGDWKAVRQLLNKTPKNPDPVVKTELYNLKVDPAEANDVAAQNPEIVARLERRMAEQHTPSKVFPLGIIDRKAASRNSSVHRSGYRR